MKQESIICDKCKTLLKNEQEYYTIPEHISKSAVNLPLAGIIVEPGEYCKDCFKSLIINELELDVGDIVYHECTCGRKCQR